ncbi:hypothetical protein [Klebsiella aerogenes]|uniref:hypothetical protein n=1 Tax=Klebsiella aerogenes TaxID=548 RepID=UPI001D0D75D6|nr:hypothetical protein [Klebsiella aerogenes]
MISMISRQSILFIVEKYWGRNEASMIPDYLTFIRRQDRSLLPYLYFICTMLIAFYVKNRGYLLTVEDAFPVSAIFSLTMFSFVYELKAYWAYKYAIKNINFSWFQGKKYSQCEAILWHPLVATACCLLGCYLVVKAFLLFFSSILAMVCIVIFVPIIVYMMCWFARNCYVKQLQQATVYTLRYRNLHHYACLNVTVTFMTSFLVISPLVADEDFSLSNGFFSAKLIVAMLILCSAILAVNLIFAHPSRRYTFLGRLFQKEFDVNLAKTIPFTVMYRKSLWLRLVILFILQLLWIVIFSLLLKLLGWEMYFYFYFILCMIPAMGYFYLHVYWRWHDDYMTACDMYLRCGENNN